MSDITPKAIIAVAALGDQTVDVGIPFEIPAKSMENHDTAGSEVSGFVHFKEHTWNNAGNKMEKTMVPQVGQKRLWQRKGTNLSLQQLEQPYMAPPKEG